MPEEKPVVTILRGDDSTRIEALLGQYQAELGSADMASLNTANLDGKNASVEEIKGAAMSMPFLAAYRLVIVNDALARFDGW